MKILLYNPDNGVTRNFMPHLWMFLLRALTPPGHEVLMIDGNAKPMDEQQLVRFIKEQNVELVGIGAMTRMVARAYHVADAVRAAGVPVVMGGPHVTELPDEALGRDGGPQHADSVALGEADETWPKIVEDAARGELKDIYAPVDETGKERKPSLQPYPVIPWDKIDLDQFNWVPKIVSRITERYGSGFSYFNTIPIESGRGCPYGCEFCTVTGFFGDQIRFRSNESVVQELLLLKRRGEKDRGKITIFFIDDNFAINIKRTKSLLRDIIAANAQLPWIAQISANLLRDEELVDLMAESGCVWVFIGMESLDPANLAGVNKSFNKPDEYATVLNRLAKRNIYAITAFIFGLDNDTPGVANRTPRIERGKLIIQEHSTRHRIGTAVAEGDRVVAATVTEAAVIVDPAECQHFDERETSVDGVDFLNDIGRVVSAIRHEVGISVPRRGNHVLPVSSGLYRLSSDLADRCARAGQL